MGTKNGGAAAAQLGAAVDDPGRIRNVVLVGPSGAGKTTLVEALLAAKGAVPRLGSVPDGTTVCDHDPAAVRQQHSVGLAVASLHHEDVKVNLIDTPGYADFTGELRAGLRAADAALFVVGAGEGFDEATAALWQECAEVGMPRAVVLARLDHPRADFAGQLEACARAFGGTTALHLLDGENLVDLLTEERAEFGEARAGLIEAIIEQSEDQTLMDRYLDGAPVDHELLVADLEKAIARGSFYPVLGACAATGAGIEVLLDLLTRGFPSPLEHPLPEVTDPEGAMHQPVAADPSGPLTAEVVHTTVDAYVGRVSLVRVFSGTLRPDGAVHVCGHGLAERGHSDHDVDERVTHIYSPFGAHLTEIPYCVAGDLCALTKVASAETGDTVSAPEDPIRMAPWPMPEPLLPVAVGAKTRSDEDALARNLSRLAASDPTLRLERNAETHQLVLWCMGESHADVVLGRLRSGGAEVETEPVRVATRETFAAAAGGHGKHVKQSGGHGQYAVCDIEVQPLERGAGFEFLDRVVGGAVPRQFVPSVEKGVRAQMETGIAGAPLVDIRVTLVDGKAHSVDSSDAAFQTAGALALKAAAETAGITALEPLDEVTITVGEDYLGTILGDLSSRRARVLGTEPGEAGQTVITAEIPAGELVRYATELRSMTAGTGRFRRRFVRYETAPEHVPAPRGG
ncbi:elongation factor G-like protein EF-G2 [Sciscionella marina]|uniref:elongation factor G-like protein EF-G2 n=1 Tax=Sciscionella marina TaxID=508770 RepID=UPI000376213F|nr:elongation factor G-like protein EF-G2 [Sciscionella marina]